MLGDLSFGRPEWLWALALEAPLALLLLSGWRSRRRDLVRFSGSHGLAAASVSPSRVLLKGLLALGAFALLTVALADPLYGLAPQPLQRGLVDLVITLDVSTSMGARDAPPTRLAAAKGSINRLLERLEGTRVGLVLFAGSAIVRFPLTSDLAAARLLLDNTGAPFLPRPGSNLAEGLRSAMSVFDEEPGRRRAILLVSDGEAMEGDGFLAVESLHERGIRLYTLGVGTLQGSTIPLFDRDGKPLGDKRDASGEIVITRLDEPSLRQMAELAAGGYHRHSTTGAEAVAITDDLSRLEGAEASGATVLKPESQAAWPLALTFLLLLLDISLQERRRSTGTALAT
ncbi:MAG: VWA domain-containing protein [Chloroflexi bacterium]|nr:VWA domain-containing protein [Chloroflexota bacterium]